MSTTVSFRIDEESAKQLEQLAKATDRTKAWHAEQAMKEYLDLQRWQIEHIRAGIKQADAGMLIDHEEVFSRIRKRIAKTRKKRA
jgi:RHH-type rel operon transcriptional repressor/antitoxin RelB